LRSKEFLIAVFMMLASAGISYAQELPSTIRGYKVHRMKVEVRAVADKKRNDKNASVNVGEPRVVDIGLDGITLEANADISGLDQDGQIDFLMFKDVLVNGIPLVIDDYEHMFTVSKGATVTLPIPIRGRVSAPNMAKAAYKEATASRDRWQVTGTVFVFGRFKKMGFTFKRVVPVPIDLTIPNPLRATATAAISR
jgi:hypothetical protein